MKISIEKGTRGVRARYDAALPPFISFVRSPGRPVILVSDRLRSSRCVNFLWEVINGVGVDGVGVSFPFFCEGSVDF